MSVPISTWDALYRQTDQPKTMTLTFSDGTVLHNADIILEQMSLEESLCSEENLRYGCCESSCFQVRIANTEKSFEGLYLNVVQGFPIQLSRLIDDQGNNIVDNQGNYINGGDMYFSQYGNFLVVSDTPTGDRQYRDLTCYDKMYEIIHANVIDWYEGLTFPMTVKDFRDSFFEYLEIEQVEVDLINDDFEVQGEFYVSEELSGRMVIESICELNGAFGHINRDGLFEYITLPTEDSITYPHYVNGTCAYEDYETEAITGVRAINVDGDSGTIVGTEDNIYIMQSNILTFGSEGTQDLEDALDNLLDLINEFTYTPFKVTTYGNPMLPLGTNVTFETKYKTINSFVMTRFLSGIQALRDTFTALGDKLYPSDVNRIKSEIQRSAGTTHKLVNDVNTLDSEIFDEHGNSRIQQSLEEIVLKVDNNGKLVQVALGSNASQGSTFTINANFIDIESNTIKFDNSGYQVKGDIYTTYITPNNNQIYSSYSELGNRMWDEYRDYDAIRMIQERNMGYFSHIRDEENDRYPFGEVFHREIQAYNVIMLSSLLGDFKSWLVDPIERRYGQEVDVEDHYMLFGKHCVLSEEEFTKIKNDGGYVDSDNYLHFGEGKTLDDYYMIHDVFLSIGIHQDEDVFSHNENAGFCKVPYQDFDPYTDWEHTYHDFSGSDIIVAIAPRLAIGREDMFDFSGLCWGKWSELGRESLKGTISGLQVQSSSDKRLKHDIKEIDENLIKAICECPTYQFKFNNSEKISVGIIAQDFVEACKKFDIDPDGYSLCQKRTIKDNDNTEYYYIEYSQYLTLKSIYLQRQIDELKELIKK